MELILYSLPDCTNCLDLKGVLASREMAYTERDMSTAESLTHLRVNGCFLMVAPVLEVNGKFLDFDAAKNFVQSRVMQ